jgi:GTP-binding protein HflX
MAALSYQRTRLVRAWTHLERQRGGLGFVGGPGETQIESDKRAIDSQLKSLRGQLRKVVKTRELHRKRRSKTAMPIVSLVGYTNAGKSTLFNKLTNEDVLCKDMLFATLDPTVRISKLRSGLSVIMSDTVGFISDLPTELIASFRSTLEEVLNSDVILHVRDISHPNTKNHSQDVLGILEKIGLDENIPVLEVWNKIDLHPECQKMQQPDISLNKRKIYPVCAASGLGLENLKTGIINVISSRYSKDIRCISTTDGKKRAWLYRNGVVESERLVDENYKMVLRWSEKQRKQFDLL